MVRDPNEIRGQIRIDLGPLDLTTIVELFDERGIMFDDQASRDRFFGYAEGNPIRVPYGAALSHAKSTNLGIWDSSDLLYKDCARIMVCELQRLLIESSNEEYIPNITLERVIGSQSFRRAFDIVRQPKEAAMHNLVRGLGTNAERLPHRCVSIDEPTRKWLSSELYKDILIEVMPQRGYRY